MLILRKPELSDIPELRAAYTASRDLHHPWTAAPLDFTIYCQQEGRFLLCSHTDPKPLGTFHISGIIRGAFHSGYLGYEVFAPYQRRGYMREGLRLMLAHAFFEMNLHRLEANIQPDNLASIALVKRGGFVREGFSKNYLRIAGEWRDHERWAIVNADWDAST